MKKEEEGLFVWNWPIICVAVMLGLIAWLLPRDSSVTAFQHVGAAVAVSLMTIPCGLFVRFLFLLITKRKKSVA